MNWTQNNTFYYDLLLENWFFFDCCIFLCKSITCSLADERAGFLASDVITLFITFKNRSTKFQADAQVEDLLGLET